MKKLSVLWAVSLFFLLFGVATGATIDLSTWSQQGSSSNGTWTLASDNSSVVQSINGNPTYFVSDTDYINTTFEGNFKVTTTSDDDYIGFVFGFNGLDDYYLFDWKQSNQYYGLWGQAYEGFTLSKITASSVGADELWDHIGTGIEVLSSDHGTDKGWADNTDYEFALTFQENRIIISIDGTTIFDISGSFSTGKFGFYNFSQSMVSYQGFTEDDAPPVDPVPEPGTVFLLGLGLFGLAGFRKKIKIV